MLGVLGILLAIAALVILAWRRWNAIVCALIATLIIGVFNGFGIWGTLTDYFLPAAGNWVTTFILMFLTSSFVVQNSFIKRNGKHASKRTATALTKTPIPPKPDLRK